MTEFQFEETRQHLMMRVSWMYFIEGLKQDAIADAVGLSRMKVNRLLAAARESGVVNIEIRGATGLREDLTRRMKQLFGLQEVHIAPRATSADAALASVGFAAGDNISRRLRDGLSIGIGSGRTTHAVVDNIHPREMPALDVVAMKGSLSHEGKSLPHETVSRLAYLLKANAYQLAAPSHARTPEEYRLFTELPMISQVLARARSCDMALVTATRVADDGGLVEYGFISAEEINSLRKAGAVAALLGVFIDLQGQQVDHSLNERQIGVDLPAMKAIPELLLCGVGPQKAEPMLASLRTGVVDSVFTDEDTAEAILVMAESTC